MRGRSTGPSRERWPALAGLLASLAGGLIAILIGVIISELRDMGRRDATQDRRLDDHERRIDRLESPISQRQRWAELYAAPGRRAH